MDVDAHSSHALTFAVSFIAGFTVA